VDTCRDTQTYAGEEKQAVIQRDREREARREAETCSQERPSCAIQPDRKKGLASKPPGERYLRKRDLSADAPPRFAARRAFAAPFAARAASGGAFMYFPAISSSCK
jgi:hypothetical protein